MTIELVAKKTQSKDVGLNTTLGDYKRKINEIIKKYKEVIVQGKEPSSPEVGTIWLDTSADAQDGGGVNEFIELIDTPANYTGKAKHIVRVNASASALEFLKFEYDPDYKCYLIGQ